VSVPAVRVERLGKRYRLGEDGPRYDTLREEFVRRVRGLGRGAPREPSAHVWALRDVSLEIAQGDVVAIIGRNGAGKSTLLRILARVTAPTSGRVALYGRVASLLDVGTGFHPELTGRENVFLNGAVLGMTRAEIRRKFDEIVAFAEVERFIDTPTKRYSSGMWVRLAFAVAAHLEAEILIIDEALAVGDLAFQRRCLAKMEDARRAGRTVVFVSHDLATVTALATRAVLLDSGRVLDAGRVPDVVRRYLETTGTVPRGARRLDPAPDLPCAVTAVATADGAARPSAVVARSEGLTVLLEGEVRQPPPDGDEYYVAVDVRTSGDVTLFRTHSVEERERAALPRVPGPFRLECRVPADLLAPGTYRLGLVTGLTGGRRLQAVAPLLEVDVVQDRLIAGVWPVTEGLLTPRCAWRALTPRPACAPPILQPGQDGAGPWHAAATGPAGR